MSATGPTTGVPFGRYTLIERLAKGGMGEVHLAMAQGPLGISKPCVIKLLLEEFSGDREQVRRFIEEARIMVSLSHRNIVQMLEFGRVKDEYFIAMEYIDGLSLGQLLNLRAPLPPELGLFIAREVLSGLAHAHGLVQGGTSCAIIHRDISPSNVLISFAGDVKLVDFGLARTAMSPQLTGHGVVVGKLAYLSPELLRRDPHTPQSDLYAMGICLFEMATGIPYVDLRELDLFKAVDLMRGKRFTPPSSVRPGLPPAIDEICSRALAPDPAGRYIKAAHMRRDVQKALAELAPATDGEALAKLLAQAAQPQRKFSYPAPAPSTSSDVLDPDTVSLAIASDARWLAAQRRGAAPAELRLPGMRPFELLTEGAADSAPGDGAGGPAGAPAEVTIELELPDEVEADPTLLNRRADTLETTDTARAIDTTDRQAAPPRRSQEIETPAPTEADTLLFGPGHRPTPPPVTTVTPPPGAPAAASVTPVPTPTPPATPTPPISRDLTPTLQRPVARAAEPPQPAEAAPTAETPAPAETPVSSLHTEDTARLVMPETDLPPWLARLRREHFIYGGAGLGVVVLLMLLRLLLR